MRTDDYYRAIATHETQPASTSEPSTDEADAFSAAYQYQTNHPQARVTIQHSIGPKGPWRKY